MAVRNVCCNGGGPGGSTILLSSINVGACLEGDGTVSDPVEIILDPDGQIVCGGAGLAIVETITTLVDNLDGTITYTREDGGEDTISIMSSGQEGFSCAALDSCSIFNLGDVELSVPLTNNQVLQWDSGFGFWINKTPFVSFSITDNDANTQSILNGNTILFSGVGDVEVEVSATDTVAISFTENVSTLEDQGAGVFLYTDEEGTETTIDVCGEVDDNCPQIITTLINNGDGSYTYTSEDATETTFTLQIAESGFVCSDLNSCSITNLSDVHFQGAPTEDAVLRWNFSNSRFELGTAMLTFTVSDGANSQIIANSNTLTISGANDAYVTVSATDNVLIDVDVCGSLANCVISQLGDVSGETPTTGDALVWNGSIWTPVAPEALGETTTTLVDNNNGTITYTNELSNASVINICNIVETYCASVNFVDNEDGTFTYTHYDDTTVDVDICAAVSGNCAAHMVNNGDGSFTFTNGHGETVVLDICTTIATFCDVGGGGSITKQSTDCIALNGNGAGVPLSATPILAPAMNISGGLNDDSWDGNTSNNGLETFDNALVCTENGLFVPCPIIEIPTGGVDEPIWMIKVACDDSWDIATFPASYEIYRHAAALAPGDDVTEGLAYDLALDSETGEIMFCNTSEVTHTWQPLNATAGYIDESRAIVNGTNNISFPAELGTNVLLTFIDNSDGTVQYPDVKISSGNLELTHPDGSETWTIIVVSVLDLFATS